jgi:hypothetical protein
MRYIPYMLALFRSYPLLTANASRRLEWFVYCWDRRSSLTVAEYLSLRGNFVTSYNPPSASLIANLFYFPSWLVGLVVAEGSFYGRTNGTLNFNVSQADSLAPITAIKIFFDIPNVISAKLLASGKILYVVETNGRASLGRVIEFFLSNPVSLQGSKLDSFRLFVAAYNAKYGTNYILPSLPPSS